MNPNDRAALELAMQMARREPGRGEQLDFKLRHETWKSVAQFAAYSQQVDNLHLRPWEVPPIWIDDPNDLDAFDQPKAAFSTAVAKRHNC